MNNNKRIRFIKGNILDLAAVLVLILLLICTYVNINSRKLSLISTDYKSAVITVNIDNPSIYGKHGLTLRSGDVLYVKGKDFGTIKSIEPVYRAEYVKDDNKLLTKVQTDDIAAYAVAIDCKIKTDAGGCYVSASEFVAPGLKLNLSKNGENTFDATVFSIAYNDDF